MLAAQTDKGRNGEDARESCSGHSAKRCRHRYVKCGNWFHEGGMWHLSGKCDACGYEALHLSLADKEIVRMYEEMQKELRNGEADKR